MTDKEWFPEPDGKVTDAMAVHEVPVDAVVRAAVFTSGATPVLKAEQDAAALKRAVSYLKHSHIPKGQPTAFVAGWQAAILALKEGQGKYEALTRRIKLLAGGTP